MHPLPESRVLSDCYEQLDIDDVQDPELGGVHFCAEKQGIASDRVCFRDDMGGSTFRSTGPPINLQRWGHSSLSDLEGSVRFALEADD